jgi:hypothetical protein
MIAVGARLPNPTPTFDAARRLVPDAAGVVRT